MRALLQRARDAEVVIDGRVHGAIDHGLVVFLGYTHGDTLDDSEWIVRKTCGLRVFEDDAGRMNLDLAAAGGGLLLISQFTLYGDCRKGRRPAFTAAMEPSSAEALWDATVERFRRTGLPVQTGVFAAHMKVRLVNDGPVTLLLESPPREAAP